ncbi:MAG: RNA polymerase subunit sigma [Planctomycetes bacterium]|nr:RNA polymerase subunit sigma [Planctomycetota bacterium]
MPDPGVSAILQRASSGDRRAADDLLPLVYSQLRAAAQNAMRNERPDHTLQATALVHEAYAKMVGGQPVDWANRAHFYDAAARAMRQILIDHARAKNAEKRGGDARREPLSDFAGAFHADPARILALDEALSRLEREDEELASVVRFRFFAGLSGDDTAQVLNVSPRKVDMLWARARAWLFRELEPDTP